MGKASDRLQLTQHMYESAPVQATDDRDDITAATSLLEETAKELKRMGANLGLEGSTGDAAWDQFSKLASALVSTADQFSAAAATAERAHSYAVQAREAYRNLPDGDIDGWQKTAIIGGGTLIAGPLGMLGGHAAVDYLSDQAAAEREAAAKEALTKLHEQMSVEIQALPEVDAVQFARSDDTEVEGGNTGGGDDGTGGPVRRAPRQPGPGMPTPWPQQSILDTIDDPDPSQTKPTPTPTPPPTVIRDPWPVPPVHVTPVTPDPGDVTPPPTTEHTWPDNDMGNGWVPGSTTVGGGYPGGGGIGGYGGGYDGSSGAGGYGGAMAGGLAFGGAAAGAVGLGRGLGAAGTGIGGVGGVGGLGGAGGVGGIGVGGVAGAGASTTSGLAGSRSSSLVGGGATTAAGAAGGRTGGGAMGAAGAGGAAGSANKKRGRRGPGYLGPDIDIEDDDVTPDLGTAARAGGRGSGSAGADLDVEADDSW